MHTLSLIGFCLWQIIPIIHIEGYGDRAAEMVCQQMKITSQNDTKKLAEAKAAVYLKGFTIGVMTVGPHKGKKVNGVMSLPPHACTGVLRLLLLPFVLILLLLPQAKSALPRLLLLACKHISWSSRR